MLFNWAPAEPVKPVKVYSNPDLYKEEIIKENRGESGIYMRVNKSNVNRYIGSSVNLGRRLGCYFSDIYLEDLLERSKSSL